MPNSMTHAQNIINKLTILKLTIDSPDDIGSAVLPVKAHNYGERCTLCSKAWNRHNYICTYFQLLQFTKTVCTSLAEPLVSTWILFFQGTAGPMIKWLPIHVCANALSLFFYICEEQHQKIYRSSESYNHRAQLLWWSKVEHDLDSTPTLGTSCKGVNDILLVESEAMSDKGFDINATTANEVQTQWICVAVSENTKNVHFPVAHKVLKESDHKRKLSILQHAIIKIYSSMTCIPVNWYS